MYGKLVVIPGLARNVSKMTITYSNSTNHDSIGKC